MKKVFALALALALALCLGGCSRYTSSYRAMGFVHSNSTSSAFMNFYTFEGRMVFKLTLLNDNGGRLEYSAKLESGSARVYYDNGEKLELVSVNAGDEIASASGPLARGTVYVIVETDGKCQNGAFHFELDSRQDAGAV